MRLSRPSFPGIPAIAVSIVLAGCTVGPDYTRPVAGAPADWSAVRAGDPSLHEDVPTATTASPSSAWWKVFGDPVLDALETDALAANPDLQTAALRFAQSRAQRQVVAAQRGPQVDLTLAAQRQRQSENGAMTRTLDVLAPPDRREALVQTLSQPFDLYQGGFDASWEPDFWGRVRRAVEAADAESEGAAALLDAARLDVSAEVARNYFALRGLQRRIAIARDDIDAAERRFDLMKARAVGGMLRDLDATQQQAQLADLRARVPSLLAEEAATLDRLSLLLGQMPGTIERRLTPTDVAWEPSTPDLALGLPSGIARRRPDIRQAEAVLHEATANTGAAIADLYPSIRLGASFGMEAIRSNDFGDWGSRRWSVGPSLDLPLFDMGRRRGVVTLRKLQQQEAAVVWQGTVLQAWADIDTALAAYAAERQRNAGLRERERLSKEANELAESRYAHGQTSYITALDAQRTWLAARGDLAESDATLGARYVAVCKAIGGGDTEATAP